MSAAGGAVALALLASGPIAGPARAHMICTELEDAASGRVLLQAGRCDQRVTPAADH